ncbi:hypothetical protein NHQ30_004254 [Ciborinia camelliae]|nr:hypothetical protein NHQ30_004254 [Ciborinia camelliae]
MPPKNNPKFKPKAVRANPAVRAERAMAEKRRLDAVAAENAAALQARGARDEMEVEEEAGGNGGGEEMGEQGVAGGAPNTFAGLVSRPKNQPSAADVAAQRARQVQRRKAHKKAVAQKRRMAQKKEDAPLIKSIRNLRIAQRIAAGGDADDEEEEDEDEEDEIWVSVLGGSKAEDYDDDDDDDEFCGGAGGGLGGMFGGGGRGAGGQGVSQPIKSGN